MCDVVSDPYDWSLKPVKCNDGNSCTFDDMCQISATEFSSSGSVNVCRGTPYSCPLVDSEATRLAMTCAESSMCNGDGGCISTPKPNGTVCYNVSAGDPCMPIARCDGQRASCPAVTRVVPVVTPGTVDLQAIDVTAQPADLASYYQPQSRLLPMAEMGSPYTDALSVGLTGWSTACGTPPEFALGYYTVRPTALSAPCDPRLVRFDGATGLGPHGNASVLHVLPFDDARYNVTDGTMVQVVVRTRNFDGVVVDRCLPSTVVIDSTRPNAGRVTNVDPVAPLGDVEPVALYGATLAYAASGFSEDNVTSTWGGMLKYQFAVAAYPLDLSQPSYWVVPALFTAQGTFASSFVAPFVVPDSTRYVGFVRAFNRAGLGTAWVSAADIIVDRTGPLVVGRPSDGGFVNTTTAPLTLSWAGVFTDVSSGRRPF